MVETRRNLDQGWVDKGVCSAFESVCVEERNLDDDEVTMYQLLGPYGRWTEQKVPVRSSL